MICTRYFSAVVLVALVGCQQAETPEQAMARMERESAAARAAIEAQNARFARFFAAGQADSMLTVYTEDAELLPPNAPAVSGRENIRQWLGTMVGTGTWSIAPTTVAVIANGPHAIERGRFIMSYTPGPNAPAGMTAMTDTGKFIAHWRNEDGQWRMAHDIWNSNRPLPPPPAPARRR